MGAERVTIVIAWTVREMSWDGDPFRKDLGERPKMIPTTIAKACTWLLHGEESDLEKAQAYADRQNLNLMDRDDSEAGACAVFTYPTDCPDPLERAKRDRLAMEAS